MVEVSAVEKVWMNGIHTINGFLPPLLSYPVRSTCVDFNHYIFTACSSYGFSAVCLTMALTKVVTLERSSCTEEAK